MGLSNWMRFLWLTKENPTDRERFWWRLTVSTCLTLLMVFVAWSSGLVPGSLGHALETGVDMKIAEAVAPIYLKLQNVEREQTQQSAYLKRLVRSDLRRLLRDEFAARCKSTDSEEKSRINATIDRLQLEHESVAGSKYDEPDCENL